MPEPDRHRHNAGKCLGAPSCMYCVMERPFAPAELELASKEGDPYAGYNQENECCLSPRGYRWALLGWPVDKATMKPKQHDEDLVWECPNCGGKVRFILGRPDTIGTARKHQPPAIARARLR